MIVAVLFSSVTVLLRMGFETEFGDVLRGAQYVDYAVDIYFGSDILLNFFLDFRRIDQATMQHTVILDFPNIAGTYLRGWFLVDFFSTLAFDLIFLTSTLGARQARRG